MEQKILALINEEDKKKPLTDEQLAKKLLTNRSRITLLRQNFKILDSRERRKPLIIEQIKEEIKKASFLSEQNLTNILNSRGFSISRCSISTILKEMNVILKSKDIPELMNITDYECEETHMTFDYPFKSLIGFDRSLKVQIEQAKAAVLYPPNGLHTMILGQTGVGKSDLAEAMYRFALQINNSDVEQMPFITFNCADYAETPQLLLSQLFGYQKGAFTGAETDRDGLVAKADGGILFLDEVHRLPPDGQEMLFQLIDKNKYRRLGETNVIRNAKVMIIAATTEDVQTSLLKTFRRRIPMIIQLPPLSMRPMDEKFEIIKTFFLIEAARIKKKIVITHIAMRALILYECIGNIGQLRSDIQVAIARAFLSYISSRKEEDNVKIDVGNLPLYINESMLDVRLNRSKLSEITINDLIFLPDKREIKIDDREDVYVFPDELYTNIEYDYRNLEKQGLPLELIDRIVMDDLESRIREIINHRETSKHKLVKQDLKKIVGTEIFELVQKMVDIAKASLVDVDDTLFYCLSTHLYTSVKRIKEGNYIKNFKMANEKKIHLKEYEIAVKMASLTNYYLGIELPEDEIGFITMYLNAFNNKKMASKNLIGILIITHGHIAEGMANLVNRLLGTDHVKALEMSLDEKLEIVLEKAMKIAIKIDKGKGVIFFVDMGSLSEFGEIISQKTGIVIRTISRVDTVMVLDAVRKVLLPDTDINYVAESLAKQKTDNTDAFKHTSTQNIICKAVISLCLTGEGTAKLIQKIIKEELKKVDENIKVVTLGILDENDINKQIEKISRNMTVLTIIGTINPGNLEIPFISSADIIKGNGLNNLLQIISSNKDVLNRKKKNFQLREGRGCIFNKDLIFLNKHFRDKNEAIVFLCEHLLKKGFVAKGFVKGVLARENLSPTVFKNNFAIPHGYSEDVINPIIGIITLKDPIEWGNGFKVTIIYMLAINESIKNQFSQIYNCLINDELIAKIKSSQNSEEILNILNNFMR